MTESPPRKVFLILSRQAPYGNYKAQQAIDIALASAVFEQDVIFAFLDDGVFQLLAKQNPVEIHAKPISGALDSFQLYGIDEVYVDIESLEARNLQIGDLGITAKPLDNEELRLLINKADCVFSL